jgi:NADH-quinone oxidoreductase subunit D
VDSVAFVWPAANWGEREARDLGQARFHEHPDPVPLLRRGAEQAIDAPPGRERLTFTPGARFPASAEGLAVEVETDRQRIVRATPHLGLAHVGVSAHISRCDYRHGARLAARVDAFSAMACDLAYALACERLLGVEVPPRARLLRTVYGELQRLGSHLHWLARSLHTLVDPAFVAPSHVLRAREAILDLFQWLGGNAITPDVIAIGGLHCDAPDGFVARVRDLLDDLSALLADLDGLLGKHDGLRSALEGVGVIDRGTAVGLGLTGPALRACGVPYDVRDTFPYAACDTVSVDVPVEDGGDAWARFQVRRRELRASLDLVQQCLAQLSPGHVNAFHSRVPRAESIAETPSAATAPRRTDIRPLGDTGSLCSRLSLTALPEALPAGVAYASVEGPRGELGVLIATNRPDQPPHVYVRGPSFANLSALPYVAIGLPVDRLSAVVDSFDLSAGEAAR